MDTPSYDEACCEVVHGFHERAKEQAARIRFSCDHCGEEFVHGDGCPEAEVDGEPVGGWTSPITVDGDGTVVSGHHRADFARQLDLPLAANKDGRGAP